jgi:hypothetical protein
MSWLKILACLLFACAGLLHAQAEDLGLSPEQMEDKLLALVNSERAAHRLLPLAFDPLLRDLARAHSAKMAATGVLAHDFPGYAALAERAAGAGLPFSKIGENVADSETFVVRFFHEALLESPRHRENILDPEFTHLGIGFVRRGEARWVTQEFARLYAPLPAPEMEGRLERRLLARFRGRMPLVGGVDEELVGYCRRSAAAFLQGVSPARLPEAYGTAAIVSLSFAEEEAGFVKLLSELHGARPLYWCHGVAFARNAGHPGGAYALTLVTFPDLRDELGGAAPDAWLYDALLRLRPLKRSAAMERTAAGIAGFYARTPDAPYLQRHPYRFFNVLRTASLSGTPAETAAQFDSRGDIHAVGIRVLYPLAEGLRGNHFIVAVVGGKKAEK